MKIKDLAALAQLGREYCRDHRDVRAQAPHGVPWFRISNADGERAELFIYGAIGDDWDPDDVTAGDFTRTLRGITAPVIDLHINSPGGLVFDGIAIYNALRNHPARVEVTVDGIAASAASFIAMAGDEVAIEKPAKMMIHDAGGLTIGNAQDHEDMATLLNELSDTIAQVYADRAGGKADEWRDRMRAETWFSSAQAVATGLADRVVGDDGASNSAKSRKTSANKTTTPAQEPRSKVRAAAWNHSSKGGKSVNIEEILAAMKNIIDNAEGRPLTDEEVKRYEAMENDLANKRTESIRERQHAYESPAPSNVQPAAVHVGGSRKDEFEDYNKAFENYLRTGKPNADLEQQPRMAQETGTDSEGGYTVSPQFRRKLVEVRKAFGGLASEVDSFTTGTGASIEYPSLDDTANEGSITAEEAAVADGSDLSFGTVNLGAFKYTSAGAGTNLPLRVSVELLQDSEFDIEGLVARALQTRIMRKQAADWVNGNGTTLPFGVLHDGLTADVVLDTEATLTYANLLEIEAALDPAYWQNAQWLMSANTWVSTVKALEDGNNRPLIQGANDGIEGRPTRTLLGYPVVIDNACNAITQDGVDGGFALLGDLREAYTIRRVAPFSLVVDPYSRAVNGQVQYHAWERADGNIQNRSAYATVENITT